MRRVGQVVSGNDADDRLCVKPRAPSTVDESDVAEAVFSRVHTTPRQLCQSGAAVLTRMGLVPQRRANVPKLRAP